MITVLGSINMDLIANVGRLPTPGETVAGSDFATAAGGKGANQALAARRAGSGVIMAGAVGQDTFAPAALALLDKGGVDLSRVSHVGDSTGTAVILVGADGENMIAVVPGANGHVGPEHALATVNAMSPGDFLILQAEIPAKSIEAALRAASSKGVTTVFNTAPLTPESRYLFRLADIVISNLTEFQLLTESDASEPSHLKQKLRELHDETGQTLIVTLGSEGVLAIHKGETYCAEGLEITPVDTVGAGDSFCGYLTASLDQRLDFAVALKRGAIAGSLACLAKGAQPAIPFSADVDRVL